MGGGGLLLEGGATTECSATFQAVSAARWLVSGLCAHRTRKV